ncbi:MAG: hypothetical protein ACPG7F_01565 [Aggregatilineales bacterium]
MKNPLSITFEREFETETSVPQDFVVENLPVIADELQAAGIPVMHSLEIEHIRDTIHAFTLHVTAPGFQHTLEGMIFQHNERGETIIRGKAVAGQDLSLLMMIFAVLFLSVHIMTVPGTRIYMLNHAIFMTGALLTGLWLIIYWLSKQIERRDRILKSCYAVIDALEDWYAADGDGELIHQLALKNDDLYSNTPLKSMKIRS